MHHMYRNYIKFRLNKVLKQLVQIPSISHGGCGITAYYLSLILHHYKEPYQVATMHAFRNKEYFENNYNNQQGSCACHHLMLSWNGYYVGSDGIFKQKNYNTEGLNVYLMTLPQEKFKYILEPSVHGWNKEFNRDIFEPEIIQIIQSHFPQINI